MNRGWPPTPIARSSSGTGSSPRSIAPSDDSPRIAAHSRRWARSGVARPCHCRCGCPRSRLAPDGSRRRQRASQPNPSAAPGWTPRQQLHRTTSTSASDPLWWLLSVDQFGDQAIDRVDVAATGPTSPVPPGLAHLPGPGQYDASPALERLLASTPTDQLAERFAGHQTGTISPAGLPSPNSLIIVIGHELAPTLASPGGGRGPRHPADTVQLRCL